MKNQLIQFTSHIEPIETNVVVPFKQESTFFVPVAFDNGSENSTTIDAVTPNGDLIKANAAELQALTHNGETSMYASAVVHELSYMAPFDVFRFRVNLQSNKSVELKGAEQIDVPKEDMGSGKVYYKYTTQVANMDAGQHKVLVKHNTTYGYEEHGGANYIKSKVSLHLQDGTELANQGQVPSGNNVELQITLTEKSDVYMSVECYLEKTTQREIALTIKNDGVYKLEPAEQTLYSNVLVYDTENYYSKVMYKAKDGAFGLPFDHTYEDGTNAHIQQTMPLMLNKPQYKQEDEVYTKRNGEQVVLFANITKEYEGMTDYIPMEWHEKILLALSCDEVYINGERVTKSNTYEIDHENFTHSDFGIKLLRATFKVTTNVTQRNSNY